MTTTTIKRLTPSPSNSEDEIARLSAYLNGFGDATDNQQLKLAAEWLDKLKRAGVCAGGIIGCMGGFECTSDHK